jgi:hypothetical protein
MMIGVGCCHGAIEFVGLCSAERFEAFERKMDQIAGIIELRSIASHCVCLTFFCFCLQNYVR